MKRSSAVSWGCSNGGRPRTRDMYGCESVILTRMFAKPLPINLDRGGKMARPWNNPAATGDKWSRMLLAFGYLQVEVPC